MNTHLVDKVLSFALVLVGLAFLAFSHQTTGGLYILGVIVVMGGVVGLVNSQSLQMLMQTLEKLMEAKSGENPTQTSVGSTPTSSGVSSTGSLSTSSVSNPIEPGNGTAVLPPGSSYTGG